MSPRIQIISGPIDLNLRITGRVIGDHWVFSRLDVKTIPAGTLIDFNVACDIVLMASDEMECQRARRRERLIMPAMGSF